MERFTPVICAVLSGILFFISTGLGGTLSTGISVFWAIALVAPVPVLWLAFKSDKDWVVFVAALAAGIIGASNILPAYLGTLPAPALAIAVLAPGLILAVSVWGARFVARRLTPISGIVAFAALWAALDYLSAMGPDGAVLSPGYSQMGLAQNIQIASQFGVFAITAVMGLFAASLATYAVTRKNQFALFAVAVIALNAGYGQWRISHAPAGPALHVGLAADDGLVADRFKPDEASAMRVVKAYNTAAETLAGHGSSLIVLPERLAMLKPEWRSTANAAFITTAHIGHATIVAGFDDHAAERQNVAQVYFSNGVAPATYAKRRLIPGLESIFVPGTGSFMLSDRTGVAVCKDMDFPSMIRTDAILQPNLYAVPAWDFGKDGVWHARLAIMRGVENGFAVARAANNGLLTLSDAYGRVVALRRSSEGTMVLAEGDLTRGPAGTLYTRIGDAFAWVASAMALLLLGVAALAKRDSAAGR